MEKKSFYGLFLLLCVLIAAGYSDTFKHKETGETFNGFVTQKSTGGMTRVYNSTQKKFVPVSLNEYEVTLNAEGRRENVVLVPIMQGEVLLSQTVAEQVAQAIVDASNAGPLAILVQIDSPGGRGEYMRIIAAAIAQTTNCPVIAYISGGTYGGAYNAAAVVAVACDKIFIAPTAAIGAVGPIVGSSRTAADYQSFLETYAPETLSTYSTYVTALAQEHNRPQAIARGLIDRKLSIIEVTNPDGTRDFILRDERQPNQTLVRTLAEGVSYTPAQTEDNNAISAVDVIGAVLNLTAAEAVRSGLADQLAASRQEVLTAMDIGGAQVIPAQGIDNVIKKFTAAKRNIAAGLAQIERLEAQAQLLDGDLKQVQEQLTTGTGTRETLEVVPRQSYEDVGIDSRYYNNGTRPSTNYPPSTRERVTSIQPSVDPIVLQNQLAGILRQLVGEYRRVINLADRWPGGLPADLSLTALQSNLNSAAAQLNNLYNLSPNNLNQNVTPYQNVNPYQGRTPRRRGY